MASEVVFENADVETVIPVLQFVDGVKVTVSRLITFLNASFPMEVTEAGMAMEVSEDTANASNPISVHPSPSVTFVGEL